MHYRLTVTKNDKRYFSTCDTSIIDEDHLKEVYTELIEQFTSDKGYEIEIFLMYTQGDEIKMFKHRNGLYEVTA